MEIRRCRRVSAVCMLLLTFAGASHAQEGEGYEVIVNYSNPVSSLRTAYVSDLFLGKIGRWDHGEDVASVDRSAHSPVRARCARSVHHRSVSAVKSHWQQMIFSGRGVPPPELGSDAEVVAFVQRDPGAIGYVSNSASLNGVKVVEILK